MKRGLYFRVAKLIGKIFIRRKNLIEKEIFIEPCVFVGHHQNFYGPISAALWFPESTRIWAVSHMFYFKENFKIYYNITFRKKIKLPKILAFFAAGVVSFIVSPMLRSVRAIPVYRGSKEIWFTFEESLNHLSMNKQIIIFPDVKYNSSQESIRNIYTGFLYLEKIYFEKNGNHLKFVPVVFSKSGNIKNAPPITFSGKKKFNEEKEEIGEKIRESINFMTMEG